MATLQMTDTQQCTFTVSATDERGNPVPLPAGTIEWLTDNTDLLNLVPSADGNTCNVLAKGPLGTATVACKVHETDGTSLAAGTIDVNIIAGAPVNIVIQPGPITEQP